MPGISRPEKLAVGRPVSQPSAAVAEVPAPRASGEYTLAQYLEAAARSVTALTAALLRVEESEQLRSERDALVVQAAAKDVRIAELEALLAQSAAKSSEPAAEL